MNVSEYTKRIVTLNDEERKTVEKITEIIDKFVDQGLCENMKCCYCPLAILCSFANSAKDFEETLSDIANME